MTYHLTTPLSLSDREMLRAGDSVLLSGIIYTARDAAHRRLYTALQKGENLPLDLTDIIIYYMGPSPGRPGRPIGSAGPTTAGRMDRYTPALLHLGVQGMIGKGKRNDAVIDSMIAAKAIYFAATGGAGALLSKAITASEIIAYEDLGTEAIRRLEIQDFPVIVVIDTLGNDLYKSI